MSLLVISGSLNPESNSRVLAREAHRVLTEAGHTAAFLDLRDLPLPPCDGASAYSHPQVAKARAILAPAAGILIASPIYNYDASAAVKNLIELTGRGAWENKIVGFACASGGVASYMSIMALANSLMLDFRCTIVPRFVYSVETDFKADLITNPDVARRVAELATTLARYATALRI